MRRPRKRKAARCAACRGWVNFSVLCLCQAPWLCYRCGAPIPAAILNLAAGQ